MESAGIAGSRPSVAGTRDGAGGGRTNRRSVAEPAGRGGAIRGALSGQDAGSHQQPDCRTRGGGDSLSGRSGGAGERNPAGVLVSDGYDADRAANLQESGGYLLRRPLQEPALDRVLAAVESRGGASLG